MNQRILVCGDRNMTDYKEIHKILNEFPSDSVVIHGNCRGADKMAGRAAKKLGMEVMVFPADWKTFGKAAGPIRNTKMLDEGHPDVVIAFHPNISQSKGTKNMIDQACMRNINVILIEE